MNRFFLLVALLAVASPAGATDGVIEINQVCATQTGCAPGDAAGYPITLDTGSYRLTSSLDSTFLNAIVFSTVSPGEAIAHLDMNGFSIRGTGLRGIECGSTPCLIENGSIFGATTGITSSTSSNFSSTIRDVRISGGVIGINCSGTCHIERISVSRVSVTGVIVGDHSSVRHVRYEGPVSGAVQSGGGIFIGNDSSVEESSVRAVGTSGIVGGDRCRIVDNVVRGAGSAGIRTGVQSVVEGNVSTGNGGDGIFASTSSVVANNSASENGADGIRTDNASTIRDNSADTNGGDGIEAGTGSHVTGNTARSNGEFGLRAEAVEVGYGGNVFGNNNGGPVNDQTSSGTDLGGNLCDDVATCP